jgi:alkyl hydroperoxide reductase subunit AhpC
MAYLIQKSAPEWTCEALMPDKEIKAISSADYAGKYLVLFYYPLDFTFVCPTEIIAYSEAAAKFKALNCEVIAASCDNKFTHLAWVNTPRSEGGLGEMQIPILADFTKEIASKYGCLLGEGDDKGVPLRALFIISDKGIVRHMTMNDLPVGRNVEETLRLVEAYQYTDTHGEVCPAGWKRGDPTMKDDPTGKLEYFSKGYTEGSGGGGGGGGGAAAGGLAMVTTEEQFRSTVGAAGSKPVVVMYSASWCGNCKKVSPSVAKLSAELAEKADFVKVDTEALQFVEDEFSVESLPTFQVFKGDAKPAASFTGSVAAKVLDFIKANV